MVAWHIHPHFAGGRQAPLGHHHQLIINSFTQLAKWDVQLRPDDSFSDVKMGVATFRDLLVAIVRSSKEVDVDLLLLVKDEVSICCDSCPICFDELTNGIYRYLRFVIVRTLV